MPKLPIPDDWNGEDWRCIKISWPNSPLWIAILNGLLTQASRGRWWDERTGSIIDVQKIGREIWDRNRPFRNCDVAPVGEITSEPGKAPGQAISEGEEQEMPNITWLSLEDGVLQMHFGPCCKIAVDGNWSGLANPPPTGTEENPGDPNAWACNKAAGIATSLVQLAAEVIDAISALGSASEMYTVAHQILVLHNSTWELTQAVVDAYVADDTDIEAMLADGDTIDWLACTWSPHFADTDNISSSEFYSMQVAAYSAFDDGLRLFWSRMVTAVGVETAAWWARLFHGDAASCDCPEVYDYTGVVTFEDACDNLFESQGAILESVTQQAPHVMRISIYGGDNDNFQEVHWDEALDATGDVSELEIVFPLVSADRAGYYPAENWSDTNPTTIDNYLKLDCTATPDDIDHYPQPDKQVMILKWDVPTDLNGAAIEFQVKVNPKAQSGDRQRYIFDAQITYAGVQR